MNCSTGRHGGKAKKTPGAKTALTDVRRLASGTKAQRKANNLKRFESIMRYLKELRGEVMILVAALALCMAWRHK
jgi:hypothetical protein